MNARILPRLGALIAVALLMALVAVHPPADAGTTPYPRPATAAVAGAGASVVLSPAGTPSPACSGDCLEGCATADAMCLTGAVPPEAALLQDVPAGATVSVPALVHLERPVGRSPAGPSLVALSISRT